MEKALKRARSPSTDADLAKRPKLSPTADGQQLPIEIWTKILGMLDLKTMLACGRLNSEFQSNVKWIVQHHSMHRIALCRYIIATTHLDDLKLKVNYKLAPDQPPLSVLEAMEDGMGDEALSQSSVASSPARSVAPTPPMSPVGKKFSSLSHSQQSVAPSSPGGPLVHANLAGDERTGAIHDLIAKLAMVLGMANDDPAIRKQLAVASAIPTQANVTQANDVLKQDTLIRFFEKQIIQLIVPHRIVKRRFTLLGDFYVFFQKFRHAPAHSFTNILKTLGEWAMEQDRTKQLEILMTYAEKTVFPVSCEKVEATHPFALLALVVLVICGDHEEIEDLMMLLYRKTALEWVDLLDFLSALKLILMVHHCKHVEKENEEMDEGEPEGTDILTDSTMRISTDIGMTLDRMQLYQLNQSGEALTHQQQTVVAAEVGYGKSLLVQAFAGTGKTTTLKAFAKARPNQQILYVAFNKALQKEAEKCFQNHGLVTAKTIHSLAWQFARNAMGLEKMPPNKPVRDDDIAKMFHCSLAVARNIQGTLDAFMSSTVSQVSTFHVPFRAKDHKKRFESKGKKKKYGWTVERWTMTEDEYVQSAQHLWNKMRDSKDPYRFTHDGYLKYAHDAGMKISQSPGVTCDYILFDEVQDVSEVMIAILKRDPARKVMVGDRHQRIYGFRRAVRQLLHSLKPDSTMYLSQSFRFGIEVAHIANLILCNVKAEPVPMIGCDQKSNVYYSVSDGNLMKIAEKWSFVCRTNVGVYDMALKLIIRYPQATIGACVGQSEFANMCIIVSDVHLLKTGQRPQHWPIHSYNNYQELVDDLEDIADKNVHTAVKLVETFEHFPGSVMAALGNLKSRLKTDVTGNVEGTDFVIATTHKAKGLEWDNVAIGDDFLDLDDKYDGIIASRKSSEGITNVDDLNLLYVAITRTKVNLLLNTQMAKFCSRKLGCTRYSLAFNPKADEADGHEYYYNSSRNYDEIKFCTPHQVNSTDTAVLWIKQLLDDKKA